MSATPWHCPTTLSVSLFSAGGRNADGCHGGASNCCLPDTMAIAAPGRFLNQTVTCCCSMAAAWVINRRQGRNGREWPSRRIWLIGYDNQTRGKSSPISVASGEFPTEWQHGTRQYRFKVEVNEYLYGRLDQSNRPINQHTSVWLLQFHIPHLHNCLPNWVQIEWVRQTWTARVNVDSYKETTNRWPSVEILRVWPITVVCCRTGYLWPFPLSLSIIHLFFFLSFYFFLSFSFFKNSYSFIYIYIFRLFVICLSFVCQATLNRKRPTLNSSGSDWFLEWDHTGDVCSTPSSGSFWRCRLLTSERKRTRFSVDCFHTNIKKKWTWRFQCRPSLFLRNATAKTKKINTKSVEFVCRGEIFSVDVVETDEVFDFNAKIFASVY